MTDKPSLILRDFPDHFETERLLIRSPLPGDGPALNEAVLESLDTLRPWMPWAQRAPSVAESEETVRKARLRFLERSDLMLLLLLKGTNIVVGGSGLHRMNWDVPKFEIGYWCRSRFEGQGYIAEAVRGITRFAFETLGANRVEIHMDSRNLRSRRVAERTGYVLEGELRNYFLDVQGNLENTLIFSLLPHEFKTGR